jgi:arsenical pump membrane protein
VKLAWVGAVLCVVGLVAVATGVLPVTAALDILDRIWPILLFVVAITVVAELAAVAGLFDHVAAVLARLARGRTWMLWATVVALAVTTTAFLSLDTTAVLLTPVVVTLARRHRLDPVPFAFVTVVLANTASLLLPVSNLTNLLAADRWGSHDPVRFLAAFGPSAAIAIAVSVLVLTLVFLPRLPRRHPAAAPPASADRVLLRVSAIVVAAVLPLLVIGLPPWMPAAAAAAVLGAFFLRRAPRAVRFDLVPWSLIVFAVGLFAVVGAATALGAGALASALAGPGGDLLALWRLAGAGALSANGLNNLPAFLALEATAETTPRLGALLVGVNVGPLITPWASLATLLWHARLRSLGVSVRWRSFILLGCVIAPLSVAAAVVPLAL